MNNTLHKSLSLEEPNQWQGGWKIGGNLTIMVLKAPTEQQIKNTEETFGWEWVEMRKELKCHCYHCSDTITRMTTMIVCPECGNKRCPKATDHNNECTNSNEAGQKGSRY